MTLDTTVRARIDSGSKNKVETIFHELGLTTSQAIDEAKNMEGKKS